MVRARWRLDMSVNFQFSILQFSTPIRLRVPNGGIVIVMVSLSIHEHWKSKLRRLPVLFLLLFRRLHDLPALIRAAEYAGAVRHSWPLAFGARPVIRGSERKMRGAVAFGLFRSTLRWETHM